MQIKLAQGSVRKHSAVESSVFSHTETFKPYEPAAVKNDALKLA